MAREITLIEITIDDETAATLRATAEILSVSIDAAAAMVLTRYAKANHKAVVGALEHVDS